MQLVQCDVPNVCAQTWHRRRNAARIAAALVRIAVEADDIVAAVEQHWEQHRSDVTAVTRIRIPSSLRTARVPQVTRRHRHS